MCDSTADIQYTDLTQTWIQRRQYRAQTTVEAEVAKLHIFFTQVEVQIQLLPSSSMKKVVSEMHWK